MITFIELHANVLQQGIIPCITVFSTQKASSNTNCVFPRHWIVIDHAPKSGPGRSERVAGVIILIGFADNGGPTQKQHCAAVLHPFLHLILSYFPFLYYSKSVQGDSGGRVSWLG